MTRTQFLPFALPDLTDAEIDAVVDTLRSGWITTGPRVHAFEHAFAEAVEARHAVALNSCTAAMHLALEAVGLSEGDLVVTTPYTFTATAEVIRYFNAIPVFVDIDPETFNIDLDGLDATLKRLAEGDPSSLPPRLRRYTTAERAKAVMPVHVAGLPCDLDRIYNIAGDHGAAVIEDAAHAFPAVHAGRPVGAGRRHHDLAAVCFSFYATKTLTTGEGGMLVTDNEDIANRARMMALHGINKDAWNRYSQEGSWYYEVAAPGYKYNMTDMAAAMGQVQLARAHQMGSRRLEIARRYSEVFASERSLELPVHAPSGGAHAWHLYMLRLRLEQLNCDRAEFIFHLNELGIGASVHFIPLHMHPYYRETFGYKPRDFPAAVSQYEREISLPIYSRMSDEAIERVIDAVVEVAHRHRA